MAQPVDPVDLVKQRMRRSLTSSSLDDLVKAKKKGRKSFLLYDYSGSMDEPVGGSHTGSLTRKIDALRSIDKTLTDSGVNILRIGFGESVGFIQQIPKPAGMTPLHKAIQFAAVEQAEHLIVVSDGAPDSEQLAMEEAIRFGGPIDVFYVGPPGQRGEDFLNELCNATGGSYAPADLADQKQLTSGIRGLLGA